ncbi:UNVERIFIED_ORG: hypothetical protein E4P37_05845 [Bacillus sp. AZ43]
MTIPKRQVPAALTHLAGSTSPAGGHPGHRGHGLMRVACCVPMLVIAVALVATGAASPGFLLVAVLCTAMMAMMMGGMHDGGHGGEGQKREGHLRDDTRPAVGSDLP